MIPMVSCRRGGVINTCCNHGLTAAGQVHALGDQVGLDW